MTCFCFGAAFRFDPQGCLQFAEDQHRGHDTSTPKALARRHNLMDDILGYDL